MITWRIAVVLFASLFGTGCSANQVAIAYYRCAEPTAAGSGQPQQTPELVGRGNVYLGDALRVVQTADSSPAMLQQSSDCFVRALQIAPDSYEAQLGLSVAYLARARLDSETANRSDLLQAARHMLGRAYMLRHGAYEPLYYLAEVAAAGGELKLAQRLLEPLRGAGVKEGPVNLLLGEISEREGKTRDAAKFYLKAISAGWPSETVSYAAFRFRDLDIHD
jgi:tetratricopeptide (TPR) repeat protein